MVIETNLRKWKPLSLGTLVAALAWPTASGNAFANMASANTSAPTSVSIEVLLGAFEAHQASPWRWTPMSAFSEASQAVLADPEGQTVFNVPNPPSTANLRFAEPEREPFYKGSKVMRIANPARFSDESTADSPPLQAQDSTGTGGSPADLEGVADPELGIIRVRSTFEDPELGILRIREQPVLQTPSTEPRPIAYLTGRLGFVSSDNIFLSIEQGRELVGDEFFRYGLSLGFYPALGTRTLLIAAVDTNFQRYINRTDANYDEVRLRLGLRQGLTPRAYGEVSWSYQQLFEPGIRDRFFENRGLDLTLGRRDSFSPTARLDSFYRAQLNFSEPASFDRFIQSLGAYASYDITSNIRVGLGYQLTLADYTQVDRYDTYHQLIGQIVYFITPTTRLSLFGGYSFGRSSTPNVRFQDTLFGVFLESTVPVF